MRIALFEDLAGNPVAVNSRHVLMVGAAQADGAPVIGVAAIVALGLNKPITVKGSVESVTNILNGGGSPEKNGQIARF